MAVDHNQIVILINIHVQWVTTACNSELAEDYYCKIRLYSNNCRDESCSLDAQSTYEYI